MQRSIFVLGLLLVIAGLAQAGIKGDGIALEAELAQRIEEPMKIDDSDKGKGASNEKFIWMEGEPAVGGGEPAGDVRPHEASRAAGPRRLHCVAGGV